jgi:hypothetical protein
MRQYFDFMAQVYEHGIEKTDRTDLGIRLSVAPGATISSLTTLS